MCTAQWVTRFRQSRGGNCFKSNCKPCYSFKLTLLTQTRNRQISISENEFIISIIIHDVRFLFCCIRYLLLLICFLQLQDKSKRASLKKRLTLQCFINWILNYSFTAADQKLASGILVFRRRLYRNGNNSKQQATDLPQ